MPVPDAASTRTSSSSTSASTSPSSDGDSIPGTAVGDRLRTFLAARTTLSATTLDCDALPRRPGARGSCRLVFSDGAGYDVQVLLRDAAAPTPDLVFDLTLTTPIPPRVVQTNVLGLLRAKFPGGPPVAATCKPLGPSIGSRTSCLLTARSGLVYAADVALTGWDNDVPKLSVQVAATPTTKPI